MSNYLVITVTAVLVATACGLLGPYLVLRKVALLGDAVSHAVLPGIVATFLIARTRAPFPVIIGAAAFAVICVLAIEVLAAAKLVRSDAAIALVFPTLFALGVLGIHRYAANVHLDLDSTIYGEIAFAPFRLISFAGGTIPRSILVMSCVVALNVALIATLWKELKLTSFDPGFARTVRFSPRLMQRLLLVAVAVTAVTAFESVGAILVVTLLIVPAATAYLLTDKLAAMVLISVAAGWVAAIGGQALATALDASIAGAMGLVAATCFALAFVGSRRYGVVSKLAANRRSLRAARADTDGQTRARSFAEGPAIPTTGL